MWQPGRAEQARVAARVRELVGERSSSSGAHRRNEAEPAAPRSRWEPTRAVVIAMAALVVLVIALAAWWYVSSRAPAVPVSAAGGATPAPFLSGTSTARAPALPGPVTSSSSGSIVVDVAGKVVHPGVYRLPSGSRVDDALRAAGGAAPGVSTTSLNLAAPLHDGDQVVVGAAAPAAAGGAAMAGNGAAPSAGPVDLNTATEAQLDALPGVGPVLARHILDWRNAHGGFTSVDQLHSVSGIGDAKFADLAPLVSI